MPRPISDQVMVITGASSGIGRATALEAARRGARVVLSARNDMALRDVAGEIYRAGGRAYVVVADVSRPEQVQHLADEAVARFGRIDTWINDAATSEYAVLDQMSIDEIDQIIRVDLLGVIYGTKAAIAHMKANRAGTIVNVGSVLSERAVPLQSIYVAAKHGIRGFTDAVRLELERLKSGINITLVMPSSVNTPFFSHARSRTGKKPEPLGPVYEPEAVAESILYAAEHPRREITIGGGSRLLTWLQRYSPALADKLTIWIGGKRAQQSARADDGRDSLFVPLMESGAVHGDFGRHALRRSMYTRYIEQHPAIKTGLIIAGAAALAALLLGATRRAERCERSWMVQSLL